MCNEVKIVLHVSWYFRNYRFKEKIMVRHTFIYLFMSYPASKSYKIS